ncbi:VWA domain-containing protein, partial [bacterium]|nr:VWA domain-containing protein [bacterium]
LIRLLLLAFAVVCIVLALLRPQWGKKDEKAVQEGRDLLVLLDISRSMRAADFKPNRLEFAKLKLKTLLSKFECERVGLVLFSGSAFVHTPMTRDFRAFELFLDQVDVELISSGTTAIDRAMMKAVDVFSRSEDRKNKLVLLVTDGEDFSVNFGLAKQKAKELGLRVITYGVGTTDGAPVPKFKSDGTQAGHEVGDDGKIAMSKLGEEQLKMISNSLDGIFVRSSYSDGDVDKIVEYVSGFEREKFGEESFSIYEERYPIFTGLAAACLALEWLLW